MINHKMLCVLWIVSSAGIAGIVTAMAQKPQPPVVLKAVPVKPMAPYHDISRTWKTDKLKPGTNPQHKIIPAPKSGARWV